MAATIKDIAKMTGLGLATISSYLNGGHVREKNRIKIEAVIEELHFEVNEVARGLKTNQTKLIGMMLPELNNLFFSELIMEVEDILRTSGYATLICDCRTNPEREKEVADFLKKRRVEGVIIIPGGQEDASIKEFQKANIPVVLMDRDIKSCDCDCVLIDNQKAAQEAVETLIHKGHKKIGILAGPDCIFTAKERLIGYQKALKNEGIELEESYTTFCEYTIAGGIQGIKKLVGEHADMTAVFISNYELTMGAVIGANEIGIKIPDQLSVIGFDNEDFAKACTPKLYVVTQPTKEIAGHAAMLMLDKLNKTEASETSRKITLKAELIEGESISRK